MRLTPLLTIFTTLCSVTTAIPLAQDTPAPALTPTPTFKPSAYASHSHSASASPVRTPVGAYQCPQQQYKACCQSLEKETQGIFESLGELVPFMGGVQVSSKVSFQCALFSSISCTIWHYLRSVLTLNLGKNMGENTDPATCKGHGYSPMCCSDRVDVRFSMLMLPFRIYVLHTNMLSLV